MFFKVRNLLKKKRLHCSVAPPSPGIVTGGLKVQLSL